MMTKLIEKDFANGRNVISLQTLELAQAEYSALVLKAFGINDSQTNVFTEQLISAESLDNFVIDNICTDEPVVDENDDPVVDNEGNPTIEVVCQDVYMSGTRVNLSLLNASFAQFDAGFTQQHTLATAYANLEAALEGNEDALIAFRQSLWDAINANPILDELGIDAKDIIDLTLALLESGASSGPVQEVTTAENINSAIITARNRISAGEAEFMAFDGDPETKWLDHNDDAGAPTEEDPSWIQVQFAQAHAVSSLFITSANDGDSRAPENFNIIASNDGVIWVKLAEFAGASFDSRFERKEFKFSNGLEYSYYRINITKNKGNDGLMQLADIALVGPIFSSVDHTDPVGSATITARNRIGAAEAETMAFDNDPETKWLDHNDDAGAPTEDDPSWVRVDFTESVAVNVLGLTSANDADARDPENFNILGSNNGGETWVALGSWVGESFDARFERKLFNFGNTLPFSSYRLNITKNN